VSPCELLTIILVVIIIGEYWGPRDDDE